MNKGIEFGGIEIRDKSGNNSVANELLAKKEKSEKLGELNGKIRDLEDNLEELQERRNKSVKKEKKEEIYNEEQKIKTEIQELKKQIRDVLDSEKIVDQEQSVETDIPETEEVKDEIAEQVLKAEEPKTVVEELIGGKTKETPEGAVEVNIISLAKELGVELEYEFKNDVENLRKIKDGEMDIDADFIEEFREKYLSKYFSGSEEEGKIRKETTRLFLSVKEMLNEVKGEEIAESETVSDAKKNSSE